MHDDCSSTSLNHLPVAATGRLAITVIVSVSILLTLTNLGAKSAWSDETYSILQAQQTLSYIWANPDPGHPPLYPAILHFAVTFSDSEAVARLPSALASIGTVLLVYAIGKRLAGTRPALLAAALASVSPLAVWYAQEARHAALATFFLTFSVYGAVRSGWLGRAIMVGALTVGSYTYFIVPFVWAAFAGVWVAINWNRSRTRAIEPLLGTGVAALFFLPMFGHFQDGFQHIALRSHQLVFREVLTLTWLTNNAVGFFCVVLLLSSLATMLTLRTMRRPVFGLLFAQVAVLCFVVAVAVSPIPRAYSVKRLVVVGWPLVLLFVAHLTTVSFRRRYGSFLAAVLLSVSLVASLITLFLVPKDDWRGLVSHINAHGQQDDIVLVPAGLARTAYAYYGGRLTAYAYYGGRLTAYNSDEDEIERTASVVFGDIWLIVSRTPRDPIPSSFAEGWLDEHWTLAQAIPFYRLEIRRYAESRGAQLPMRMAFNIEVS